MFHAIDVHPDFQPDIDWSRVRHHNTIAICKVSEGIGYKRTTKNRARRHAVRANHMIWGPYHFARPSNGSRDPVTEADFAIEAARECGWDLRHDLPMILDIEATALGSRGTLAWCDRFCTHVKHKTGRGCIVYTGSWFWIGNLGLARAPHNGNLLWFSAYVAPTTARRMMVRMRGFRPVLWQYTDRAHVDGAPQPVDRSVALIDDHRFRGLIHR